MNFNKKLIKYIAKKTVKYRYKGVGLILKHLTPVLYDQIDIKTFSTRNFKLKLESYNQLIRPSINFMKEFFKEKLVKGCEIGIAQGIHSESIIKHLNIEKLYLIDIWDNYEGNNWLWAQHSYKLVQKKFKNDSRIIIKKAYSKNAIKDIQDNSLNFIYIDGNHQYEYVYQDISLWYSKLKINGVMAGHDICLSNVMNAVKDFCFNKKINFKIEIPDWYFIKEKGDERCYD